MAVWQFKFEFLPLSWVRAHAYDPTSLYDNDFVNSYTSWIGYQATVDIDELFIQMLPVGTTWHDRLSVWGESGSNEINVWREHEIIEEISLRFDLRSKLDALPAHAIGAARQLDCALFVPEQHAIFDPDLHTLLDHVKRSRAAQFVLNPKDFLSRTSDE